jgi:hypothetical protein
MPENTDAAITLPDDAEFERVVELLGEATDQVGHLAWRVRRVGDIDAADGEFDDADEIPDHRRHPGDEVPSFEAVGRLFSYASTLNSYLEETKGYVNDLGGPEALYNLDSVRVQLAP